MSNLQSVDVVIFGTTLSLVGENSDELVRLANDLNKRINDLITRYPNVTNQSLLLILAGLKILEENSALKKENNKMQTEKENINNILQNFIEKIE
ncbi:MAG: cell division protein ZapA [Candidatus Cloacimonetes bacterium]|jgi:cell division protein ZapA (FtsZ GTPase activity inhibitor)|nr:cell division protein ZapA [Candidatus Cloacimonadota bacterium]MDD4156035.1 cell division protein ZapA [Candidatus Cloacimonadota bacterium]